MDKNNVPWRKAFQGEPHTSRRAPYIDTKPAGREGGTLLIGVSDDGLVCGTPLDREKEDEIQLFNPPLVSDNSFLPVIKAGKLDLRLVCIAGRWSASIEPTWGDVYKSGWEREAAVESLIEEYQRGFSLTIRYRFEVWLGLPEGGTDRGVR
ncbi:hypothetical protein EYF80_044098 [Liparis tanakae]|uniref:Schlafen-like protein 1 n=1 Tax=Liparis tanakae TaxID=230148 RepID=A0A4Z2FWU3_9TELE|nr:hypothetical protein EYF80_044098 [Liparis tanakae]